MSDLDKAIRDALAKTEDFDILFDALIAVVDEHMEHGNSCSTMRTIAHSLCLDLPPVSSQDTAPAPRQTRVWVVGGDETEPTESDLKLLGSNGVTFERTSYGRWRALPPEGDGDNYGWAFLIGTVGLTFTEVLSPATQTGGDQ